ncbi:MAG: hypothetical protein K0S61_4759 [Anaerocolumna sp.]|nr:hypothetical protein [Anaerocolumna sp.]
MVISGKPGKDNLNKKDAPQGYIISIEEFVKTKTLILYCKCFQLAIVYIKIDVALRTTPIK